MKNLYYSLGKTISLSLMICFLFGSLSIANNKGMKKETERIMRIMDANSQMKEYNKQVEALSSKRQIGRNTFAVTPEVQLKLNRGVASSSTVYFYDDMESGTNGWTTQVVAGGVDDIWHQTTSNAGSATHSWWAGIEGEGNYDTGNRINAALVSPTINLTSATAPISLLFSEYFMTERGWDYCLVEISNDDGATWLPLNGLYGYSSSSGNSGGWKLTNISIDAFAGANVKLRFRLDTGDPALNSFPGWFLDDVIIYDNAGSISGRTFFDFNNNGAKDTDERGLRNWFITADGPVTVTARTNERGRFDLLLPLGTYTVSEAVQSGWTQTMPPGGNYSVDVAVTDTLVDSLFFGNYRAGISVTGVKFNDIDKNGIMDGLDTVMANWRINLLNSSGTQLDFDRTDSLGAYTLFIFETGQYIVEEIEKYAWVPSLPDSGRYRLNVANLSANITDLNFGNYYNNETNAIVGQVFEDVNKNGVKEEHEPGLSGWKIHLTAQGVGNKYRTSDDSGYYAFLSLNKNKTYRVQELHQAGWCQSVPESLYVLPMTVSNYNDSVDFGNYEVGSGSISGMVYFDRNGNAVKDSGETGVSGFSLNLSGEANGTSVNEVTASDADGNFTFSGLWAGTYTVSEVFREGWLQTYPADFGSYSFTFGCEDNHTGLLFGNIDSLYLGAFRTFEPESLALAVDAKGKHLPVEAKPVSCDFCLTFTNAETLATTKLTVFFKNEITLASINATKNATKDNFSGKKNSLVLTFTDSLMPGDSVSICGKSPKNKLQGMNKWWWLFSSGKNSKNFKTSKFTSNVLRLPMPNAMNAIQVVGKGLRVGLGGPHSVVHSTYKDVMKSLIEVKQKQDRMHIGAPHCLDKNTKNKSIAKQLKYLTPTDGQNSLFAKMIALKVNILASQAGITPAGLGGLVFDDGTGASNPFNNLTIYQIAAKMDTFMTQAVCTMLPSFGALTVGELAALVDTINVAFSGPVDTTRFGGGLRYKSVKALVDVPYLRYDTSLTAKQEWIDMSLFETETPQQFTVYQNYPNPFNPTTMIRFNVPSEGFATVRVYNVLGQEVATLLNRQAMESGEQEIEFNAVNLPSGIYFYRINVESVGEDGQKQSFTDVKRMMLLK